MPSDLVQPLAWFGVALLAAAGLFFGNALMVFVLGALFFPKLTDEALSRIYALPWRRVWIGVALYALGCALVVAILAAIFVRQP